MISILTYCPKFLSKEKIKFWLKKILKEPKGPEVVLNNLIIGLEKSSYKFQVNRVGPQTKKIHVISGFKALEWAIRQKQEGKISELIVGPNIAVTPLDHNSILTDNNIDKLLLPSEWTAEFYSTLAPEIKNKIYLWPAGTKCNIDQSSYPQTGCLIFKKMTEEKLYDDIKEYLKENSIPYKVIEYGKYTNKEYLKKLEKVQFIIYLQKSESQGLALQEAWAHNIPTFVWNMGYITYQNIRIEGKISAPYLTDENGDFFKDFAEFKDKLPNFIKKLNSFRPAEYCKKNLSIETSTHIYIDILEDKVHPWRQN